MSRCRQGNRRQAFRSPVLLQPPFGIKELFTVNIGMISLVVSPVVTLLCCRILLIGDVGFTKVYITPPPGSVLYDVFPIFDADICGLEISFNEIFVSQLLLSSAFFPFLELTLKDNARSTMGFHPDNMPTPSELGTSQRSLDTFHASSSELSTLDILSLQDNLRIHLRGLCS